MCINEKKKRQCNFKNYWVFYNFGLEFLVIPFTVFVSHFKWYCFLYQDLIKDISFKNKTGDRAYFCPADSILNYTPATYTF